MADNRKCLNILQWNCRSIPDKLETLSELCDMYKIDIFLLSETHLESVKKIKMINFNIIRKDRNTRGGGVMIGIKKNLKYKKIKYGFSTSEAEIVGTQILLNEQETLDVVSVYIPPRFNFSSNDIEEIFLPLKSPFIVAGDFNAHSTEWGCVNDTPKGEIVLDILDKFNSAFLNNGAITRPQPTPRISSAVDLTLVNSELMLNCEWVTLNATFGSDHTPILTKMRLEMENDSVENKIVVSHKKVEEFLKNENYVINEMQGVENFEDFSKFLQKVRKNSEVVIPAKYVRNRQPWWNAQCSEALAKLIRLSRIFNRIGSRENYERKREAEKDYK